MLSSDEEDTVIVAALCEEVGKKEKRRKCWIHDICKKRKCEGEFHTLFPHLVNDEIKFQQYFRMSHPQFMNLLQMLTPEISRQNTSFRKAIGGVERLAVCLRFLATGDSFRSIAFSYHLGETTVRSIVHSTCNIIWTKLRDIVMPNPSKEMWQTIEKDFNEQWNFPNCVGAIDGKHVIIEAPANSGSLFFNYKKTFSVVLLALVDANYCFTIVDVGAYGKNSDGEIFASSHMGKKLIQNSLNIPPDKKLPGTNIMMPHVIVGDEAFPLNKHLMRPYPGSQVKDNETKKIFNYRLSRARRLSENAFGILTQKFRLYQRRLKMSPEHIDKVILATCCLHNYLRPQLIPKDDSMVNDENGAGKFVNLSRIGGSSTMESMSIRDSFAEYFVSPEGAVPWQNPIINKERTNN